MDLRGRPLVERKALLSDLLAGDVIRYAAHFDDGEKLLAAAANRRLEGIVSKRKTAAYIAGSRCGWLKVKTAEWKEANSGRWKLFQKAYDLIERSTKLPPLQPRNPPRRSRFGDDQNTDMAMLHRFTLKKNKQLGGWALIAQSGDIVRIFGTKTEALAHGELEKAVGKQGGTVRIHRQDGQFAEERTYPRSRDPRSSPG